MLCARNGARLDDACAELKLMAASNQKIVTQAADVSLESDAYEVVQKTLALLGGCHILINNAGVYGPMGEIESVDWQDWKRTIEINVYGSVLMSRALLPHFKAQRYGKLIQISGGGATNPLPRISAYAASKAAIVRYAETLALEVNEKGIDVNCIAPGALNTRMLDEVLQVGPDKVGQAFYERAVKQKEVGGTSLTKGAELAVFLASNASDGITGKLISAVWDNWEQWPQYLDHLAQSDVYTLRRITGKDRGFKWGDR
jgi:3-oxoacyl-[acyl-carrier protein] reductase